MSYEHWLVVGMDLKSGRLVEILESTWKEGKALILHHHKENRLYFWAGVGVTGFIFILSLLYALKKKPKLKKVVAPEVAPTAPPVIVNDTALPLPKPIVEPIPVPSPNPSSDGNSFGTILKLEEFLKTLRQGGIQVVRIKNKTKKDKILSLSDSSELVLSGSSWMSGQKAYPVRDLLDVLLGTGSPASVILEFKDDRYLNFSIPSFSFPLKTEEVHQYFQTLKVVTKRDPHFLANFIRTCPTTRVKRSQVDNASVASDITTSTSYTSPPASKGKAPPRLNLPTVSENGE